MGNEEGSGYGYSVVHDGAAETAEPLHEVPFEGLEQARRFALDWLTERRGGGRRGPGGGPPPPAPAPGPRGPPPPPFLCPPRAAFDTLVGLQSRHPARVLFGPFRLKFMAAA